MTTSTKHFSVFALLLCASIFQCDVVTFTRSKLSGCVLYSFFFFFFCCDKKISARGSSVMIFMVGVDIFLQQSSGNMA